MKNLVLHHVTVQQVTDFTNQPGHNILLTGASGSGKLSLAEWLAATMLEIDQAKLPDYPYKHYIQSDTSSISIDAVRQLEHFLSLKVPRQTTFNRVIIIENAHQMTLEAQNALLKTLEEPPAGTMIILTADSEQSLLPTIRSRLSTISVKRPIKDSLETFFEANFKPAAIKQAYAVSGGLPGLMQALLSEADHPLLLATQKARQLLAQSTYERLLSVDELVRQRQLAKDTVFILQQMAHISLQTAAPDKSKRWQTVLAASYQTAEALSQNTQPKLALTQLMLNL